MCDSEANTTCSDSVEPTTMEPVQTSCKSDFTESEIQDGGEASSSKIQPEDNNTTITDSSSCSECSTRRNSGYGSDSFDDMELTLSSLFRTPSHTSTNHSSHINSPRTETTTTPLLDGFDLLFQRITNERFAELRDIQLSERPVTGGAARGNIESFMRRAVHGPTEEEQQMEDAANRPEHVASDQMFLRQQSVVQSSLQNDFRNILERTLLARMAPATTTTAPRESEAPRGLVGGENFRSRLEALFGGRASSTPQPANPRPQARPRPVPRPPQPPHTHHQPPPRPSAVPLPPSPPRTGGFTIDAGMQLLAQSISDDLNRLESLHVVSGMLHGDFRTNLEHMVQTRISNENLGAQTRQFIRSLPGRRPHAAATSTPHTHIHTQSQAAINHGVTAELNSLKSQMEEMKRMLAMSMEIQMDTQRAVRQEVAAIFSSFAQSFISAAPQSAAGAPPFMMQPPASTPVTSGQCVICCEHSVDTVLYQCGHMCVCNGCGQQLKMDGHNCPMCRAPIRDVIRAYQTQTPQ